MNPSSQTDRNIGPYKGVVAEGCRNPPFFSALERIAEVVGGAGAQVLSGGRNVNVRVSIGGHDLAVKSFGRQIFLKDLIDGFRGGKARRTWEAAAVLSRSGGLTPFPVAFLERWSGGRLLESYFISEYQEHISSFKDELIDLFEKEPECFKLMNLLDAVSAGIRKMHGAGVQHKDLGNQNILLRRSGEDAWKDVQFVDLNRAVTGKELSIIARARDISRINLPSDLLRVFKEMYYGGKVPPESFHRWERFFRRLYAVHCATRSLRHPVRSIRRLLGMEKAITHRWYPADKDMWIWDERSGQTINVFRSRERNRHYSKIQLCKIAGSVISGALPVWSEYRKLLSECWNRPVTIKDRIGVAIEPHPETVELELAILNKLGNLPVLIRFYRHQGREQWDFAAGVVKRLRGEGRSVAAVLVQDRASVKDAGLWKEFAGYVLEKIAGDVDMVEFAHAINRVKWGIWNFSEYRKLAEAMAEVARDYPGVKFTGPAVIDFEYPFLMGVLKEISGRVKFGALSHHLYVDRRGAPENRQGGFATMEKLALVRAIARWSGCCGDGLVVSEVNWPIKGTGVYSPVGSPYESPYPHTNDPSVSEDEYGNYMLRYFVEAVCSGMAERVYWWRLVARGYGLVDDTDPDGWRERPAYAMLEHFIRLLGAGVFKGKVDSKHPAYAPVAQSSGGQGREGTGVIRLMEFEVAGGRRICMAYSINGKVDFDLPFDVEGAVDAFGVKIQLDGKRVELTGRPVYLFMKK